MFNRESIANQYVKGNGIEIGALYKPLKLDPQIKVQYVDLYDKPTLEEKFPWLKNKNIIPIDIIDNGETLGKFTDNSLDFIIANHFVEHSENPISTIENMLRVLKNEGILFLSLPDKRFCSDINRTITTFEHVLNDYVNGPGKSRTFHFNEILRYNKNIIDDIEREKQLKSLLDNEDLALKNNRFHFHCWTQLELLEFFLDLKRKLKFSFEIELFQKNNAEIIVVLRKIYIPKNEEEILNIICDYLKKVISPEINKISIFGFKNSNLFVKALKRLNKNIISILDNDPKCFDKNIDEIKVSRPAGTSFDESQVIIILSKSHAKDISEQIDSLNSKGINKIFPLETLGVSMFWNDESRM